MLHLHQHPGCILGANVPAVAQGTVYYAHACQLQQSVQQRLSSALTQVNTPALIARKPVLPLCHRRCAADITGCLQDANDVQRETHDEAAVRDVFALAAQHIVLAAMLQPSREVYRRSLGCACCRPCALRAVKRQH